jgi:hypothetical protein
MRLALGILLIGFGILGGASTAAMNMQARAKEGQGPNLPRVLGQVAGSLLMIAAGLFIARSGSRNSRSRRQIERRVSDGEPPAHEETGDQWEIDDERVNE